MRVKSTLMIAVLMSAAALPARAQILTERNVSLKLAMTMANATMAACTALIRVQGGNGFKTQPDKMKRNSHFDNRESPHRLEHVQ